MVIARPFECRPFMRPDAWTASVSNTISQAVCYTRSATSSSSVGEDEVYDFCRFLSRWLCWLLSTIVDDDDDGGHSSRTFSTRHEVGCILLTFLVCVALENPSFGRRRRRRLHPLSCVLYIQLLRPLLLSLLVRPSVHPPEQEHCQLAPSPADAKNLTTCLPRRKPRRTREPPLILFLLV